MSLESYLQKHPELGKKDSTNESDYTYSEQPSTQPSTPHKRRGPWVIVIILLILILLGVTCPSKEDHVQVISNAVMEYAEKNNTNDRSNAILDVTLGKGLLDLLLNNTLKVNNYLIFNIGTIKVPDKESKTISLGILGHVFLLKDPNSQ